MTIFNNAIKHLTLSCLMGTMSLFGLEQTITHDFLVTGGKTYICSNAAGDTGTVTWTYDKPTREGWVLPNGNILLALSKCKEFPGGGAVEVTRDKSVVWSYKGEQKEIGSIHKTPDGTYVVTESGDNPKLRELRADGSIAHEFALACQKSNAHMQTRMARKLADGTYLAPHLLDFAIIHYNDKGDVLDRIDTTAPGDSEHKIHTWPFTAIRLANGNTLVGLTHANRVAEFDPAGKTVWLLMNEEVDGIIKDACGVQRLPNGNTIVNSYAAKAGQVRLFEVTPDKKVVWTWTSKDGPGVHHMHVIATNGEALPLDALR